MRREGRDYVKYSAQGGAPGDTPWRAPSVPRGGPEGKAAPQQREKSWGHS